MSHTIHQTQAIVLGSGNFKESNKLITLFTRDFGLIRAHTQSSRELKSKMRPHLTSLSMVDVDLVQGRDMWRMTGVHARSSGLSRVEHPLYSVYTKIIDTLNRLLKGEDSHPELFDDIVHCFSIDPENINPDIIPAIEIVMLVRILNHCGYWSHPTPFLEAADPFTPETYAWVQEHRSSLIKNINHGFEISQL